MKQTILMLGILLLCPFLMAQQPLLNRIYEDGAGNSGTSIIKRENGYLIAGSGYSDSIGGYVAIKLLSIDSIGSLKERKHLGKTGVGYYTGNGASLINLKDTSSYILFGSIDSNGSSVGFIAKVDINLNTLWSKKYPGSLRNIFFNGVELADGSLVAAGFSSISNGQMWLMKTDSMGNIKWQKTFGGNGFEDCRKIISTNDGGFLLTGNTDSYGEGLLDGFVVKVDSSGNQEWQKTYGTYWKEYNLRATTCAGGGYYIWGVSQDEDVINGFPTYEKKTYIKKISEDGSEIWTKVLHQDFSEWAYLEQVRETDNGKALILAGSKKSETSTYPYGWLLKIDSSGTEIWERFYTNDNNPETDNFIYDFQLLHNGNIACTGFGNTPGTVFVNQQDFWLLVLDSMGCLVPGCDTIVGVDDVGFNTLGARLYPNPTTGTFIIELPLGDNTAIFFLYNLLGQKVFSESLMEPKNTLSLDLSNGMYLYRIEYNGQVQAGKLLIE